MLKALDDKTVFPRELGHRGRGRIQADHPSCAHGEVFDELTIACASHPRFEDVATRLLARGFGPADFVERARELPLGTSSEK